VNYRSGILPTLAAAKKTGRISTAPSRVYDCYEVFSLGADGELRVALLPLPPCQIIGRLKEHRIPQDTRPVVYVNDTVVGNRQVDVQLYFSFVYELTPGKFASVEQGLVIMAPEHALQLVKAPQRNLEAYEGAHGKIRDIKLPELPAEKKFLG